MLRLTYNCVEFILIILFVFTVNNFCYSACLSGLVDIELTPSVEGWWFEQLKNYHMLLPWLASTI